MAAWKLCGAIIAAAMLAACASAPALETSPLAQPKSLAWAQGCWTATPGEESAIRTFTLLPDRNFGGLLSGAIAELDEGHRRPSNTLTFSRDSLALAFGSGGERPTDAFWRSPYERYLSSRAIEAMRRVQLSAADHARLVDTPHFAVFESSIGRRVILMGDGASLSIVSVWGRSAPHTYFVGTRVNCTDEDLLRLDDSDA